MRNLLGPILALGLVLTACAVPAGPTPGPTPTPTPGATSAAGIDYTIASPYEGVDWSWTQYKAGLHNHTTESDGRDSLRAMVDTAYGLGYHVLAITDHDVVTNDWIGTSKRGPLDDGEPARRDYYYSAAEVAALLAGKGRGGRPGLLGIPHTDEQSATDHVSTFWTPWNNRAGASLEETLAHVDALGGGALDPVQHLNHPSRYYGGLVDTPGPNGEDLGARAASDPATVARYAGLFERYPDSLVGMEIVNQVDDVDSYSDRILWDNVLGATLPGRNVFAFSNDDAHGTEAIGYDYNRLLMPELSEQAVHDALTSGAWYSTALVARRELGPDFRGDRTRPGPTIDSVVVDQEDDRITIEGRDHTRIEWVAAGRVVATGATLDLDAVGGEVGPYVRAQLIGPNGISFTQAFGVGRRPS